MDSDGFDADATVMMSPGEGRELPGKIGKYHVMALLGKGGMGTVYLGRDPDLNRHVAIKTLSPLAMEMTEGQRKQFVERFYREARALALLDHLNIVRVHDLGEENGVLYLVMEYVDGKSLGEIIRTRPHLDLDAKMVMIRQVCAGVSFFHDAGLIHRDIKPDNIMLDRAGVIKIMDFGTVRTGDSDLTRSTQVLGTPRYMAPEQLQGAFGDVRSDVFSLGAVFYELMTGERAFTGDNFTTIAYRLSSEDPIPPTRVDPTLPPGVDTVLFKALAKNPEDRQQSVEQLRQEMESALESREERAGRTPLLRLAAMVLLLLGLGWVWFQGLVPMVPTPQEILLRYLPWGQVEDAPIVADSGEPPPALTQGNGSLPTPGLDSPEELVAPEDVTPPEEQAGEEPQTDGQPGQDQPGTDQPGDQAPGEEPVADEEPVDTPDAESVEDPGEAAVELAIPAIGPVPQPAADAADSGPEPAADPSSLPGIGQVIGQSAPSEAMAEAGTDMVSENGLAPGEADPLSVETDQGEIDQGEAVVGPGEVQEQEAAEEPVEEEAVDRSTLPMGAPPFPLELQAAFMASGGELSPMRPGANLHRDDAYKLVITPGKNCYVYLFEQTTTGLRMLFPVSFTPYGEPDGVNPLQADERRILPVEDEVFTLDQGSGECALILVASDGPDEELENMVVNVKEMDMSGNLAQHRYWQDRLRQYLDGPASTFTMADEVVLFPWRGVDRLMRLPVVRTSLDRGAIFQLSFFARE